MQLPRPSIHVARWPDLMLRTVLVVPPWLITALGAGLGLLAIAYVVLTLQVRADLIPLAAVSALALGVLIVLRPSIGLVTLVICAIAVRVSVGTGSNSPIVASLACGVLLVAGWFAHRALNRKSLNLLPASIAMPGALVMFAVFFSFLWGRLALDPRIVYSPSFLRVQIAAGTLIVLSVALLFVGADLLRDQRLRSAIVGGLILAGFFALPFRALSVDVPFVNTGGLFGLWFIAICWSNCLVNRRLAPALRILLGAGAVLWLLMATVVEGAWASGWIPGMIALVVITLYARPLAGLILLSVSGVFVAAYLSFLYEFVIIQQETDGSLGGDFGRFALWERNVDLLREHLVLGTGPAGYALYYLTLVPDRAMSTHNNYFDILAQTGVLGLLSLVALLAGIWLLAKRLLSGAMQPGDQALVLAVFAGVPGVAAGMMLGDWLLPFVYNQTIAGFDHSVYSWLMFGIVCGIFAQYRSEQPDDT